MTEAVEPVADSWETVRARMVAADISPEAVDKFRELYFMGAAFMWELIAEIDKSPEIRVAAYADIGAELERFDDEIRVKYPGVERTQ